MTYGEKIASLRKSNGMTQEDLGKVLNVTYQAVSKWERGESLPDFTTMSQIAKFFQVPLSYFEEDGEIVQIQMQNQPPATHNSDNYVGTCTRCGRMVKEDDEYISEPKLLCKNCAEIVEKLRQEQKIEAERKKKEIQDKEIREQLGSGFDVKLVISLVLALACYIVFTINVFSSTTFEDRSLYALLLMFVPLAAFAIVHSIADFINELRDKDDGPEGYTRKLSFIIGAVFSGINIVLFLIIYLSLDNNGYYLGLLFGGALISFTFISQYMWGSVVRDIFTCGGFTFKLPGFIFSLTVESILFMIILKFLLGILATIIFIVTTVLVAVVAMVGSVFTFIPCAIYKTAKDKKIVKENS